MLATIGVHKGFDGQMERLAEPEMSTVVGLVKYGHMKRAEFVSTQGSLKTYLKRFLGIGG